MYDKFSSLHVHCLMHDKFSSLSLHCPLHLHCSMCDKCNSLHLHCSMHKFSSLHLHCSMYDKFSSLHLHFSMYDGYTLAYVWQIPLQRLFYAWQIQFITNMLYMRQTQFTTTSKYENLSSHLLLNLAVWIKQKQLKRRHEIFRLHVR